MSYQATDLEKAPLISSPPSTPTETPTLEALQQRLKDAGTEWRAANNAYHEAWIHTRSGRWFTRVNRAILAVVATIGGAMIAMMLCLIVYAAFFDPEETAMVPRRVPLEAHIMSKCPDAQDCLREMILPAMQNVSSYVDFKLSYIGT